MLKKFNIDIKCLNYLVIKDCTSFFAILQIFIITQTFDYFMYVKKLENKM